MSTTQIYYPLLFIYIPKVNGKYLVSSDMRLDTQRILACHFVNDYKGILTFDYIESHPNRKQKIYEDIEKLTVEYIKIMTNKHGINDIPNLDIYPNIDMAIDPIRYKQGDELSQTGTLYNIFIANYYIDENTDLYKNIKDKLVDEEQVNDHMALIEIIKTYE